PLFAIPGSGKYRLQPIFVEDMAKICVDAAARDQNETIDAVGPEILTFNELVQLVASTVKSSSLVTHVPPPLALWMSRLVGYFMGEVTLTSDEIEGLAADLLVSSSAPTAHSKLSEWLKANADRVGATYASELRRHYV